MRESDWRRSHVGRWRWVLLWRREGNGAPRDTHVHLQPEYADRSKADRRVQEGGTRVTINYETTQSDYPTLLKARLNSGKRRHLC